METRAALLTAAAPGAIAVVALVGAEAERIAAAVLRRRRSDAPAALDENRPTLCRFVDGAEAVDDAVVVRSGTGDHTIVEISVHGGVRVAERALMALRRAGATVMPAEALAEVWSGSHAVERQVDAALMQATSRRWTEWLLAQRAILPAYLDGLSAHGAAAEEREAFVRRSRVACRVARGLHVAIVGPPNAGKSTLANRLIGMDRVITSPTPGTTRDWIDETAMVRGWPVILTDTAGIRATDCEIETEAIRRGVSRAGVADLVLVIVDATAEPVDAALRVAKQTLAVAALSERDKSQYVIVGNKSDLLVRGAVDAGEAELVRVSALTGVGIDRLEARVESLLGLDGLDDGRPTAFLEEQMQAAGIEQSRGSTTGEGAGRYEVDGTLEARRSADRPST